MKVYTVFYTYSHSEEELIEIFLKKEKAEEFVKKSEYPRRNSSIIEWEVVE